MPTKIITDKVFTDKVSSSKCQGFHKFQATVLTIKYISKSKETLKLLLNIRIILLSNKIQLLQKQQFVNYFVKNLCKTTEYKSLYFMFTV